MERVGMEGGTDMDTDMEVLILLGEGLKLKEEQDTQAVG